MNNNIIGMAIQLDLHHQIIINYYIEKSMIPRLNIMYTNVLPYENCVLRIKLDVLKYTSIYKKCD